MKEQGRNRRVKKIFDKNRETRRDRKGKRRKKKKKKIENLRIV